MEETVINKLREIYNSQSLPSILNLFIDQFGEANVDSDIPSFNDLVTRLNSYTLGYFIKEYDGSNSYGHYHIDPQEYEVNGRGKPFLEYIPDLGILDYITPYVKDFIGRDHNRIIIVHFPRVRVTNEYDKFIDIQDLYAKVHITPIGTMPKRFELARTTYPYEHFKSGYAHSHMHSINEDTAGQWSNPCLGSGPIKETIRTLTYTYDKQLWGLFAFELSKYVTIESLTGGPYIRLESVSRGNVDESILNSNTRAYVPTPRYEPLIDAFIKFYADKGKFKFKFINGQYQVGESSASTIIHLSNAFIEFLNDYNTRIADMPSLNNLVRTSGILRKCIISEDRIYNVSSSGRDIASAIRINGRNLFTFKGQMVKLNILVDSNIHENYSLCFTKEWSEYILTEVLQIINYKYGKKQYQNQAEERRTQDRGQTSSDNVEKLFII